MKANDIVNKLLDHEPTTPEQMAAALGLTFRG